MAAGAAKRKEGRSAATEDIGKDELQLAYLIPTIGGAQQTVVLQPQAGPAEVLSQGVETSHRAAALAQV